MNTNQELLDNYKQVGLYPFFPLRDGVTAPGTNGVKWRTDENLIHTAEECTVENAFSKFRYRPKSITGGALITGSPSGVMVVDVDVDHIKFDQDGNPLDSVDGVQSFRDAFGCDPLDIPTYAVRTPSGGIHLYFRYKKGLTNDSDYYPGVDVRTDGGCIIMPGTFREGIDKTEANGSRTFKKEGYYKEVEGHNEASQIAEMPSDMFEKLSALAHPGESKSKKISSNKYAGESTSLFVPADEYTPGRNEALFKDMTVFMQKTHIRNKEDVLMFAKALNVSKCSEAGMEPLPDREIEAMVGQLVKYYSDEDTDGYECEDWYEKLKIDKEGKLLDLIVNYQTILENDKNLKDSIGGINGLDYVPHKLGGLPWFDPIPGDRMEWTDTDDSGLRSYIQVHYPGLRCGRNLTDAVNLTHQKNYYHPIRDYLNAVKWDGVPRAEKLFIDFLGCEDSEYTKTITRKILTAGVARIFEPGCKFDNMVVLVGSQGIGKSYLLSRLGKEWFSDNIRTTNDNASIEALQGNWIMEFSELVAVKKSDIEANKAFLSRQFDKARLAYRHYPETFPRQCIFFGTTNEWEFLNDTTGNRRYWILRTHGDKISKGMFEGSENFELTEEYIDQIWAEAVMWYRNGEKLTISKEIEDELLAEQAMHTYERPEEDQIRLYLSMKIPNDYYDMDPIMRNKLYRSFIEQDNGEITEAFANGFDSTLDWFYPREFVSVAEILWDVFDIDPKNGKDNKNLHKTARDVLRKEGWDNSDQMRIPGFGQHRVYRNPYYKDEPRVTIKQSERWITYNRDKIPVIGTEIIE